jgi:hypothetical protein
MKNLVWKGIMDFKNAGPGHRLKLRTNSANFARVKNILQQTNSLECIHFYDRRKVYSKLLSVQYLCRTAEKPVHSENNCYINEYLQINAINKGFLFFGKLTLKAQLCELLYSGFFV